MYCVHVNQKSCHTIVSCIRYRIFHMAFHSIKSPVISTQSMQNNLLPCLYLSAMMGPNN